MGLGEREMRRRIGGAEVAAIPIEPMPQPEVPKPDAFQASAPVREAAPQQKVEAPPRSFSGPMGEIQRDLFLLSQRVDDTVSSRDIEEMRAQLAVVDELKKQVEELTEKLRALESRPAPRGRSSKRSLPDDEQVAVSAPRVPMEEYLRVMIKHGASDLHIKSGSPPTVRLNGRLVPVGNEPLAEDQTRDLIFSVLSPSRQHKLKKHKEVDFATLLEVNQDGRKVIARFRVHAFYERNNLSAAYRLLRSDLPRFEDLGLPPVLRQLAVLNNGLILVTGPAGQGKSTTLASIVDYINQNRAVHVVTIEDPIEYFHEDKQSFITQREVGPDTHNFADGLRQALRQDPNVILVGEMRDPETIMTAVSAAETGHLVLSTLHTPNTVQAVDRIIDSFPAESQKQIRSQLSKSLRAVMSQRLLLRKDGKGRVPAVEVMVCTPAISSYILEGRTEEIYPLMDRGASDGMQTFSQAMLRLYQMGLITKQEAEYHADAAGEFRMAAEGHTTSTGSDDMHNVNQWL